MDLASGHVAALDKMFQDHENGIKFYNLSTGKGASVLDIIKAFEKVTGMKIPVEYTGEFSPANFVLKIRYGNTDSYRKKRRRCSSFLCQ